MEFAKHKSFDSFFDSLLPEEQEVVLPLRTLIFENFPEWHEKMSYGVPYYWGYARICFIWPASVPPSGLGKGVCLGFVRGHLMSNEQLLLDMGTRKEVGMIIFLKEKDIQYAPLLEMLHEAALLDSEFARDKKSKK